MQKTDAVTATISLGLVGGFPVGVAVNPVTGTVYVASSNTNVSEPISVTGTVSVISGPRFPCPPGPVGLLASHD